MLEIHERTVVVRNIEQGQFFSFDYTQMLVLETQWPQHEPTTSTIPTLHSNCSSKKYTFSKHYTQFSAFGTIFMKKTSCLHTLRLRKKRFELWSEYFLKQFMKTIATALQSLKTLKNDESRTKESHRSLSSLIRSNFFSTSCSGSSSSSLKVFYKTPADLKKTFWLQIKKNIINVVSFPVNVSCHIPVECRHTAPETPPGGAPLCWGHSGHFLLVPMMRGHPAAVHCTSCLRSLFSLQRRKYTHYSCKIKFIKLLPHTCLLLNIR